jgi:hypothetical protein
MERIMPDDRQPEFVLIDPPVGPYSPVSDIKAWIAELECMSKRPEVIEAIREAELWINTQDS